MSLVDRAKKAVRLWRVRRMRQLGALLSEWSGWCVSLADPPSRIIRSTVAAKTLFNDLIHQLSHPEVVERLLSSGLIGDDLPRMVGRPSGRRILVLAAHQDDETIGAAGTLLLCARAGAVVQVIYYTDGASQVAGMAPQEISRLREEEARRVWRRLAGIEPVFWRYPNRAVRLAADAPARLAEAIGRFRPDTIFVPNLFEQPVEHRRMSELLMRAYSLCSFDGCVEVWGYQITTRLPGNVAVDITAVWKRKYALNRMWTTQNAYMDYAHLAMGRDIAAAYYLKGRKYPRRAASYAELFLVFPIDEYVRMTRAVVVARKAAPPDFLVVGMQKSGSYWISALLDAHPAIRCFPSRPGHRDGTGEAHLFDLIATMDRDFPKFRKSMASKLGGYFASVLPARPPESVRERRVVIRTLRRRFNEYCTLQRRRTGKRLVGEKTTETVHYPGLVDELYPGIPKVCILRDPRDRVVSFFFHQRRKGRAGAASTLSKLVVAEYIDRVKRDYVGLLQMSKPVHVLTYEQMIRDARQEAASLFRFLGVDARSDIVDAAVHAAAFETLAGRQPGETDPDSHFRRGVTGDWMHHLPESLARWMVEDLESLTLQVEQRFGLDLSAYRRFDTGPSVAHCGIDAS